MLIDFTIKNYTSFKDEKTFSFLCSSTKVQDNIALNPIESDRYKLYPFSVLLGPNASGKTNLMKALNDFQDFVVNSYNAPKDDRIPAYKPFKLNPKTKVAPTTFDIEFIYNNNHYSYKIVFEEKKIISEILYIFNNGVKLTKSLLFNREKETITYGIKVKGEKAVFSTLLVPNRLLLSIMGQNSNSEIIQDAYYFFRDGLSVLFQQSQESFGWNKYNTEKLLKKDEKLKNLTIAMLKSADFQISDIKSFHDKKIEEKIKKLLANNKQEDEDEDAKNSFVNLFSNKILFGYPAFDDDKKMVKDEYLNFQFSESSGTHKLFELAGNVLSSLINGSVLMIDELSSCLHPNIELFIVTLFLSKEINVNGSQLLINTHNVSLIDSGELSREQIWFTDKNNFGECDLFCLNEFDKNKIRDYAKYGKTYLENRLGGLPNICLEAFKKELKLYYAQKEE